MKNILEVDSIQRFINTKISLSDIYLQCKTGDIIGIVGRNGCGKSMLMKIIFGTEKAEYKFIRINSKVYKTPYTSNLITYLPQHSFLPEELSVKTVINLYLPFQLYENFIDDCIIQNILNNKIFELSGGEIRYLEIKLLLKNNTKFVLLDEPLNSLSPILKERVITLIFEEKKNKGIILTAHDFYNLEAISNKIYLLHNGHLKHVQNREDLIFWKYLPPEK